MRHEPKINKTSYIVLCLFSMRVRYLTAEGGDWAMRYVSITTSVPVKPACGYWAGGNPGARDAGVE